jgi:effector-binding domain-containing protein
MAVEKAEYSVVEKSDNLELRRYDAHIVAETFVEGEFEDVGSEGFRRLAAFINGENSTKQSIAMTAPVTQESGSQKIAMTAPVGQEKSGNKWRITFLMPAEYTLETLPEPLDSRVRLKTEPARLMAAIRYSGTWRRSRYDAHLARLLTWIEDRGYRPTGEPVWARYDPPFMPWFLRRNEVLIAVEP